MNTIIGVGFSIPSNIEDDYLQLDSKSSLSDADIVVFNPDISYTTYRIDSNNSTYQGKSLYDDNSSFKIKEHSKHWENELISFLKNGKNVFVLLPKKTEFFVHTGKKETSGSGRNQKTTQIVEIFDNYKFLPTKQIKIHNSEGSKVFAVSNIIKSLHESIKDCVKQEAYIEILEENKNVLFATKNNDKILGLYLKIDKGHLIFIPPLDYPSSFYDIGDNWTKEALTWGKRFSGNLVEICKSLNNDLEKTPPPDWINEDQYSLKEAESIIKKISTFENKIADINLKINELNTSLKEQEIWKNLLYETGKPLELSVLKALRILGYTAENYDDGKLELDQIINSPEGFRYIGECEGKDNKDIDIAKFRQLSDSLNEDFYRDEVSEKAFGILFGNPQRLIQPNKRNLDFTEKCKRAAAREKVALIKTMDLFNVARYIFESNDEEYKKTCRNAIHNQLGKIVEFPTPL